MNPSSAAALAGVFGLAFGSFATVVIRLALPLLRGADRLAGQPAAARLAPAAGALPALPRAHPAALPGRRAGDRAAVGAGGVAAGARRARRGRARLPRPDLRLRGADRDRPGRAAAARPDHLSGVRGRRRPPAGGQPRARRPRAHGPRAARCPGGAALLLPAVPRLPGRHGLRRREVRAHPRHGARLALLLGGVVGIVALAVLRMGRKAAIPFGPWMAAGALLGVLVGTPIANWYLSSLAGT